MRSLVLFSLGLFAAPARAYETFEDWAFYTGDPHVHSGASKDGGSSDLGVCKGTCGSFYTIFEDGRASGLDWMAVSDHTNGDGGSPTSDTDDYAAVTAMALDAHDPEGGFVTLPAAEVWARVGGGSDIGHVTVLMFGENEDLASLELTDLQPSGTTAIGIASCDAFGDWFDEVVGTFGPALMIPHHPAAKKPMAVDWTCHFPEYQPAVEIYSEHGQSLTDDSDGFDPMWSGSVTSGTVHYAMDPDGLALEMGFMAGSDSHDTRPGKICQIDSVHISHPYGGGHTVAIMDSSESFDRESLYDAIMDRRTYATSGPTVPLVVEYSTGGVHVADVGDPVGVPTDQDLDVEVRMPFAWAEYVIEVNLVTPDTMEAMTYEEDGTWFYTYNAEELPPWVYVAIEIDGAAYYGDGACEDGGPDDSEWIWVSPSWVSEVAPDLDEDGVSWADGDCDDGDSTVSPLADELWYDGIDQDCDGTDDDQDGDGYPLDDDCDDQDPDTWPDAPEVWYDGVDQSCDGLDDDQDGDSFPLAEDCDDTSVEISPDAAELWYDGIDQDCDGNDDDQDGDGYPLSEDCDDTSASVHPDVDEVWYDGIDQDCDGDDDDQDGDGYPLDDDCDDTSAEIYPGGVEIWYDGVVQDCGGADDDQDGDGYLLADDCDDTDPTVRPGVTEVWYDGIDQNCDGNDDDQDGDSYALSVDCNDTDADVRPGVAEVWYDGIDQSCDGNDDDQDGDGVAVGDDCDDTADDVLPGAVEVWYDGIDQDCDGSDDDQDQDGYLLEDDCDDADADIHPDAAEVWYDDVDQDCDGTDDDQDGDGYPLGEDCDDTSSAFSPGVEDTCADGIDQDCDGVDALCEHDGGRAETTTGRPSHGKTETGETEEGEPTTESGEPSTGDAGTASADAEIEGGEADTGAVAEDPETEPTAETEPELEAESEDTGASASAEDTAVSEVEVDTRPTYTDEGGELSPIGDGGEATDDEVVTPEEPTVGVDPIADPDPAGEVGPVGPDPRGASPEPASGCGGCASAPSAEAPVAGLVLMFLLALRRRVRDDLR